jgi:hypothetical protein
MPTEPKKPEPNKPLPKADVQSKVIPDEPSMVEDIKSKDAPAKQY